jgi:hypothetical protein
MNNSNNQYNGWTNKETWLVNLWYGDAIAEHVAEQGYQDSSSIRDYVEYVAHECEAMSCIPNGLLMDFINDAFSEVDWDSLEEHHNETEEA